MYCVQNDVTRLLLLGEDTCYLRHGGSSLHKASLMRLSQVGISVISVLQECLRNTLKHKAITVSELYIERTKPVVKCFEHHKLKGKPCSA